MANCIYVPNCFFDRNAKAYLYVSNWMRSFRAKKGTRSLLCEECKVICICVACHYLHIVKVPGEKQPSWLSARSFQQKQKNLLVESGRSVALCPQNFSINILASVERSTVWIVDWDTCLLEWNDYFADRLCVTWHKEIMLSALNCDTSAIWSSMGQSPIESQSMTHYGT